MTRSGYFKIGAFTLLGLVMLVILVLVLGTGSLFKSYVFAETYFDQSVQGLSVGSPVLYRGVRLGTVTEMGLCREKYGLVPSRSEAEARFGRYIYVMMRIEPRLGERKRMSARARKRSLDTEVGEGFRVRLAPQGVTGVSVLTVDYVDVNANPPLDFDWEPENLYIPSAPSIIVRVEEAIVAISDIAKRLRNADYESMATNLSQILAEANRLVRSLDTEDLQVEVKAILAEMRTTSTSVREWIQQPGIQNIPDQAQSILGKAERTFGQIEESAEALLPEAKEVFAELVRAAESIEQIVARVDGFLAQDELGSAIEDVPAVMAQLKLSLKRLNGVLTSNGTDIEAIVINLRDVTEHLRELTNTARRYPSHVLFGDPPKASDPR